MLKVTGHSRTGDRKRIMIGNPGEQMLRLDNEDDCHGRKVDSLWGISTERVTEVSV